MRASPESMSFDYYQQSACKGRPMTAEEELDAFKRLKAGDDSVAEEIVLSNQRMVILMVNKFFGATVSSEDLIQAANVGMLQAMHKFDPTKGVRFITYARWWMRNAMQNECMRAGYPVALLAGHWAIASRVLSAWTNVDDGARHQSSESDIAEATGCYPYVAHLAKVMRNKPIRIDLPSLDGDGSDDGSRNSVVNNIATMPSQLSDAEDSSVKRYIDRLLAGLDEDEATVIKARFGIDYDHEYSVDETVEMTGLPKSTVRYFRQKLIREIRKDHRGATSYQAISEMLGVS